MQGGLGIWEAAGTGGWGSGCGRRAAGAREGLAKVIFLHILILKVFPGLVSKFSSPAAPLGDGAVSLLDATATPPGVAGLADPPHTWHPGFEDGAASSATEQWLLIPAPHAAEGSSEPRKPRSTRLPSSRCSLLEKRRSCGIRAGRLQASPLQAAPGWPLVGPEPRSSGCSGQSYFSLLCLRSPPCDPGHFRSTLSFAHYFLNLPPHFHVRLKSKFFKSLSSIILCVSLGDSILLYFLLKFLFYFLSLYFFFFFLKSFRFKFSAALLPQSSQDLKPGCFMGPVAAATLDCCVPRPLLPCQ